MLCENAVFWIFEALTCKGEFSHSCHLHVAQRSRRIWELLYYLLLPRPILLFIQHCFYILSLLIRKLIKRPDAICWVLSCLYEWLKDDKYHHFQHQRCSLTELFLCVQLWSLWEFQTFFFFFCAASTDTKIKRCETKRSWRVLLLNLIGKFRENWFDEAANSPRWAQMLPLHRFMNRGVGAAAGG